MKRGIHWRRGRRKLWGVLALAWWTLLILWFLGTAERGRACYNVKVLYPNTCLYEGLGSYTWECDLIGEIDSSDCATVGSGEDCAWWRNDDACTSPKKKVVPPDQGGVSRFGKKLVDNYLGCDTGTDPDHGCEYVWIERCEEHVCWWENGGCDSEINHVYYWGGAGNRGIA